MDRALRISVTAPAGAPPSVAPDAGTDRPALGAVSAQTENSPHPRLKKGAKSWSDVVVGYGFRSRGSDITTWGSRSSFFEATAKRAAGTVPPLLPTPPKRTVQRLAI